MTKNDKKNISENGILYCKNFLYMLYYYTLTLVLFGGFMNYTLEKLEKSQVKFTIEINEAEVEAAIQEAYNKNKSHYKLEGFRPGKVPRKVLEAEFGKDVFLNDALDIILPKYFEEALEKKRRSSRSAVPKRTFWKQATKRLNSRLPSPSNPKSNSANTRA